MGIIDKTCKGVIIFSCDEADVFAGLLVAIKGNMVLLIKLATNNSDEICLSLRFTEGLAAVERGNGVLSINGEMIITPKYATA